MLGVEDGVSYVIRLEDVGDGGGFGDLGWRGYEG